MRIFYVVEVSWDVWSESSSSVVRAFVGKRAEEMANKLVKDNKFKSQNKYYYVNSIEAEEVNV